MRATSSETSAPFSFGSRKRACPFTGRNTACGQASMHIPPNLTSGCKRSIAQETAPSSTGSRRACTFSIVRPSPGWAHLDMVCRAGLCDRARGRRLANVAQRLGSATARKWHHRVAAVSEPDRQQRPGLSQRWHYRRAHHVGCIAASAQGGSANFGLSIQRQDRRCALDRRPARRRNDSGRKRKRARQRIARKRAIDPDRATAIICGRTFTTPATGIPWQWSSKLCATWVTC